MILEEILNKHVIKNEMRPEVVYYAKKVFVLRPVIMRNFIYIFSEKKKGNHAYT